MSVDPLDELAAERLDRLEELVASATEKLREFLDELGPTRDALREVADRLERRVAPQLPARHSPSRRHRLDGRCD